MFSRCTMNTQEVEIDIWNGDWGLASVDFSCLQVMALMKFSGVPMKINKSNNPFRSPNGQLPIFKHHKEKLTSFQEIVSYIKSKNYIPDPDLTEKQLADILAYETMLKDKLYPAILCAWWLENKNYLEVIRPWYSKMLPFPLNYYYPGHYQRKYATLIRSLYPHLNERDLHNKIYKEAEKCLLCISNRLADSEFFFGKHASSLDALVYGYLATLLKIPLPSNKLQNNLNTFANLVRFVVRITQRYFPSDYKEFEIRKSNSEKKKPNNMSSDTFPNKARNQIFAGLFALSVMLTYAFFNGIFSISINSSDYNQYELEGDDDNGSETD